MVQVVTKTTGLRKYIPQLISGFGGKLNLISKLKKKMLKKKTYLQFLFK